MYMRFYFSFVHRCIYEKCQSVEKWISLRHLSFFFVIFCLTSTGTLTRIALYSCQENSLNLAETIRRY